MMTVFFQYHFVLECFLTSTSVHDFFSAICFEVF
jgi:hypothetical protein